MLFTFPALSGSSRVSNVQVSNKWRGRKAQININNIKQPFLLQPWNHLDWKTPPRATGLNSWFPHGVRTQKVKGNVFLGSQPGSCTSQGTRESFPHALGSSRRRSQTKLFLTWNKRICCQLLLYFHWNLMLQNAAGTSIPPLHFNPLHPSPPLIHCCPIIWNRNFKVHARRWAHNAPKR